ncbi:hypothetical protein SDJN03_01635, partial [Cucurbita argyrosperma subsp. sororia]
MMTMFFLLDLVFALPYSICMPHCIWSSALVELLIPTLGTYEVCGVVSEKLADARLLAAEGVYPPNHRDEVETFLVNEKTFHFQSPSSYLPGQVVFCLGQ